MKILALAMQDPSTAVSRCIDVEPDKSVQALVYNGVTGLGNICKDEAADPEKRAGILPFQESRDQETSKYVPEPALKDFEHPLNYPTRSRAFQNFTSKPHDQLPSADGIPLRRITTNPQMSLTKEATLATLLCLANILGQAGLGMTLAPLQIIGRSFGVSNPGNLSWFIAAYSLTVGTFILVSGRLGDIFGHKLLFVIGAFWYSFWSLIAGLSVYSRSQIFFDVCRALQGIGPAMLVPNSLAILGRTYAPGRRKDMIFAIYGATAATGFVVGAVFGSLLAQLLWWPWEYWCMAIVCVSMGSLALCIIPSAPANLSHRNSFDYLGATIGVAGLVLINVAWNQAPIVGWNTPYVYILLILGVLCFPFFVLVENRVQQPLIPRSSLSGKAGFVLGCIALGWSSFGVWIYYMFQFIEKLRKVSALNIAAQSVPAAISGCIAALTTGQLLSRVETSVLMMAAMLAFCIGDVLIATMPVGQTYWLQTFLSLIIKTWGMDISFPSATIILSDLVPKEHQGIAASLVATVVNYSISIGLGVAGTVEVHVNQGGRDVLQGYRGALYTAVGLSGTGILFALYFAVDQWRVKRKVRG